MENVFPLFEGAIETGRIKRKSLKNWLVKSLVIVYITFYLIIRSRICFIEHLYSFNCPNVFFLIVKE